MMNRKEHRQFRPACADNKLESRELLNGHFARPSFAHVARASMRAPASITGTLNGSSSYTGDLTGNDTYNLSGRTNAGIVGVAGTDSFSSTYKNQNTYSDLYFAGNWTMTMRNGSTVQIAYTGSGQSSVSTGKFFENLKGTAIGISGNMLGKHYTFAGTATGPGTTPATRLKFTMSS